MHLFKREPPTVRRFIFLLILLLSTTAFAQLEVGAGVHYGNSLTVNAHVDVPLYHAFELEHSLRPQVTYAFSGWPAVSVSYVLSDAPESSPFARYLGAGVGLSFSGAPFSGVLVSMHVLAGAEIPVAERVHAFTEVTLTTSSIATRIALGAGVRFAFGGNQ